MSLLPPEPIMAGHDSSSDRPEWWRRNSQLRDRMELPEYEPAKFSDGVYVHEVIPDLEAEYDCTIQLFAVNPEYPDDWQVRVDDDSVMTVQRKKDGAGNTVYEVSSAAFASELRSVLDERA